MKSRLGVLSSVCKVFIIFFKVCLFSLGFLSLKDCIKLILSFLELYLAKFDFGDD